MRRALVFAGFCFVLLVPSVSLAAVPSASTSTVPQLVGCPAGDLSFTVIVRDVASNPVPGSTVVVSFAACSTFTHCPGSFPGYDWDPVARTVSAVTGTNGEVTFALHQGGVCDVVSVTADGVPLNIFNRELASTDQNGDLQVTLADELIVTGKLGTFDGTASFNGNFFVDSLDVLVVHDHLGHNCGGTPGQGANAGPDMTVECAGPAGTPVQLDGTASQGTSLTFHWSAPGVTFDDPNSATPTGIFPLGTTAVLLEVQSDQGSSQDEVLVTVRDTQGPSLQVALSPSVLWPPDRRLVPIHATVAAYDTCDGNSAAVSLVAITVSGADSSSAGSDDVQDASFGTADFDFLLRAEREQGRARIYTVCYQATDASGNATLVCSDVVVARDQNGQAQLLSGLEEPIAFGVRISPNPASARATIVYSVPASGHVRLRVFDVSGRTVATLVDGVVAAGRRTVTFDGVGKSAASLYFYELEANGRRTSGRFVLAK